MKLRRRSLLAVPALAAAASTSGLGRKLEQAMNAPVLRRELFPEPVRIRGIELLRVADHFLVRVQATNGLTGYSAAHTAMRITHPIFFERVAPAFANEDARDLDNLLTKVYIANSNYKWQGLAFWSPVAALEIAVLDLLGKTAGKPLGELLGNVVRRDIKVYRASEKRGNSPKAEIEYLQRLVSETGAEAIKFRLGARMRFDGASTARDLALIPLARKVFGDRMSLYADANGSYDVPMSVRIGRLMEEYKFGFFEEPVPFDFYDETREIAGKLSIPVALGEEEMSLRGFRRIIETKTARVIQPDLLYFGGMIRSIKVARMAAAAGLDCTPHMSGGGLGYLYVAHFASCVPNAGPHQEYKGEGETLPVICSTSSLKSEKGVVRVPSGPGLGIEIDPSYLKKAVVVKA